LQEARKKEEERKAAEEAAAAAAAEELNSRTEEPLSAEKLDTFCSSAVSGCMCLLDALPESVYRVCDLLTVVATRNGPTWRDDHLLTALVAEVAEYCLTLIDASYDCPDPKVAGVGAADEWVDNFVQREEANKLATRLHLLSLLFEVSH
jgi:E3 ubiquitin-protein ligase HUWE1